jgi:hypothetical protein
VSPAAGDLPAVGQKAATRKAPDCSVRKSTTLQANRHVRVFRTTGNFVWGCRRTADRAFRLGDWGECQNSGVVSNVEVAGTYAAWISTTCGLDFSAESIELANLRTGRFAFRSSPILPFAATQGTFSGIRRIVVDDRGVVAWTASRSSGAKTIAIEVRRRTRGSGGASVVVDTITAGANCARCWWRRCRASRRSCSIGSGRGRNEIVPAAATKPSHRDDIPVSFR